MSNSRLGSVSGRGAGGWPQGVWRTACALPHRRLGSTGALPEHLGGTSGLPVSNERMYLSFTQFPLIRRLDPVSFVNISVTSWSPYLCTDIWLHSGMSLWDRFPVMKWLAQRARVFSARLGCELEASVPRDTRLRTIFRPGAWCRGKRCLGSCGSLGACPGLRVLHWVMASSGLVRLPCVRLWVSPTTNMPRGRTAFVWFLAAVVKPGHPWWGVHCSPTVLLSRGRGLF